MKKYPFTFTRELRLLTPSHFIFVLQEPQRAGTSQIIILSRPNLLEHPRVGLTIAKKHIKYAHERNRIKRLVRESFRLYQYKLLPMDFVVIAKKGVTNLDNYTILEVLRQIWSRYYRLVYES